MNPSADTAAAGQGGPGPAPSLAESLCREALAQCDFGVVILDADRRVALWNGWMERATGLSGRQAIGRVFPDLLPGSRGLRLDDAIDQAIGQGMAAILSTRLHRQPPLMLRRPGGEPLLAQRILVRPLDGGGCLLQVIDETSSAMREKTLRQNVLERQRQAELLRTLLEGMNESAFLLDRDGITLELNETAAHRLGVGRTDMIGRDVFTFFPTTVAEPRRGRLAAAVATGLVQRWEDHRAGRDFVISMFPIREGGEIRRVAVLAHDITSLKQAERAARDGQAALSESEAQFRLALTNAPIPVMLHAEDGEVLLLSRVWTDLTGYPRERIPTLEDWTALAHGPDAENVKALIQAAFEAPGRCGEGEHEVRIRTAGGADRIWTIWSNQLGRLPDARRLMVSMAVDVTVRREAEREMARLKDDAEAANRAKTAFLASMSHELRTPLTTIIGFAEIMAAADKGFTLDRVQEYSGFILESGRHLLSLINDTLDLAKIESGRLEIEKQRIDAVHLIQLVVRLHQEKAWGLNLTLRQSLEPRLPTLWADERAVRQILFNLLSNSLKFTRAGGTVTVGAGAGPDGGVNLWVQDTGIGIPGPQLGRLMRPFEQLDNRYSRAAGGTGLGLSLIKGLVELHGGRLSISSEIGVGTLVAATFPPADS